MRSSKHFFTILSVANQPLPNYLRTFRRRFGFSQKEIAILLGGVSGTKISRYENFSRMPNLATVWAYEVVFRRSARELFAGRYVAVSTAVQTRAKDLIDQLSVHSTSSREPHLDRKLAFLHMILESKQNNAAICE